eukprot:5997792-Pleurochrysis_carterae.AAC.1
MQASGSRRQARVQHSVALLGLAAAARPGRCCAQSAATVASVRPTRCESYEHHAASAPPHGTQRTGEGDSTRVGSRRVVCAAK